MLQASQRRQRFADGGMLSSLLVAFAQLLRSEGIDVPSGSLLDAGRALSVVDMVRREDVRLALRAVFVSRQPLLERFDELFDQFWRESPVLSAPAPAGESFAAPSPAGPVAGAPDIAGTQSLVRANGENPEATAGAFDALTTKDFAEYSERDAERARALVRRLAPRLATEAARRRQTGRQGEQLDLRRSLHRAGQHGGELLDLRWQQRRIRRTRVVLLCDVSGSMDRYSRHLIQFLYAMQHELNRVSTFVFSTRLQEVTRLLEGRSVDAALEQIAVEVQRWGAGTSIGQALITFEREFARERTNRRTVAVIISDGWERGDVETLRRGMAALKRRVYRVLWLNPLLGGPDYQPLARGMAAALPYVDYFLPAHNLDSLERVARTLVALSRT